MSQLTHLILSLHVTYPADLIPLLKGLVLYYCQEAIELEWQRNFWHIDLFVSTVPYVAAVLQAAFPACFRNAFIRPLDSINITDYRLVVLLSLIFIEFLQSATVVLNVPGISTHFRISFLCLCVVKKRVQINLLPSYCFLILYLNLLSFFWKKNNILLQVRRSVWFYCFSLLLLWRLLQCSLSRISFYVPFFHCPWNFLFIHLCLILFLNVLAWTMHWKSRETWYYVVSLSAISFEKLKFPHLLMYSFPCWGWNDRFSTITSISCHFHTIRVFSSGF